MPHPRIYAGPVIRTLRRSNSMTQLAMAEALDISPSYLNLVEHDQRPLSAALIIKLARRFDFDPARLAGEAVQGGAAGIERRLSDPLFVDLAINAREVKEWLAAAPTTAKAFARLYDKGHFDADHGGDLTNIPPDMADMGAARTAIEQWRNYFPDLDHQAEKIADELRLSGGDMYGSIAERLRVRHQLAIRILPADVMPERLRKLDYHSRQLQLSELLRGASRLFQAAITLGEIEAHAEMDAISAGVGFSSRTAERLFRRHLACYFAAAVMMPYARFLRACENTGYDLFLLQRRFGASFEQITHRLTTLQKVGARGLPFFMLRIDRAGQVSKCYAGASQSPLANSLARCPLWAIHEAFARPGELVADLVELEDGSRWFTQARSVAASGTASGAALHGGASSGPLARFVVAIGVNAKAALPLVAAQGRDFLHDIATPIGLGCRNCSRSACVQRSLPPANRGLVFNDNERGISAFDFVGDPTLAPR